MLLQVGTSASCRPVQGRPHPYLISHNPQRKGIFCSYRARKHSNAVSYCLHIPLEPEEADALGLPSPPPGDLFGDDIQGSLDYELEVELPEFKVSEWATPSYEFDEKQWWLDIKDIFFNRYPELEERYPPINLVS